MSLLATYFFFLSALSGYRGSKYWPKEVSCPNWLKNTWLHGATALVGAVLLIKDWGWTSGLLIAFCIYIAALCCILLTTNGSKRIWILFLIVFHVFCLSRLFF